jgi:hypothetical protein
MRSTKVLPILGLAVLAFAGAEAQSRFDPDLAEAVRDVAGRLRAIRGAAPTKVPLAVRSGPEARRDAARARRDAVLPPSRLAARGRAWADVGLGRAEDAAALYLVLSADLEDWVLSVDRTQLLVDEERLTGADFGGEGGDAAAADFLFATGVRADEPSVAHVATHVLQDERGVSPGLRETTDATLAASAWREGEANLVALLLVYGGMGLESEVVSGTVAPGEYRDGDLVARPPAGSSVALGRLVDFVYEDGFRTAAARARAGGWRALEAAGGERGGTASLLHPERPATASRAIDPPDLPLPAGYRLVDRDALGEYAVGVLIAEATGKENLGWVAADGWDADALFRFEGPDGSDGVTCWRSRFRSEADAGDFRYGMARVLSGAAAPPADGAVPEQVIAARGKVFRILQRGAEVEIRVAPAGLDTTLGPLAPEPAVLKKKNS